jgi:hypothetical protein
MIKTSPAAGWALPIFLSPGLLVSLQKCISERQRSLEMSAEINVCQPWRIWNGASQVTEESTVCQINYKNKEVWTHPGCWRGMSALPRMCVSGQSLWLEAEFWPGCSKHCSVFRVQDTKQALRSRAFPPEASSALSRTLQFGKRKHTLSKTFPWPHQDQKRKMRKETRVFGH